MFQNHHHQLQALIESWVVLMGLVGRAADPENPHVLGMLGQLLACLKSCWKGLLLMPC